MTKKHVHQRHHELDNHQKTRHNDHSFQNALDILFYFLYISTTYGTIGHEAEAIPNQQNRCSSKSDIEHPLKVRLNISPDSVKGIGNLMIFPITSFITDLIKLGVLDFHIIICFINQGFRYFFGRVISIDSLLCGNGGEEIPKAEESSDEEQSEFFFHLES